MIKSPNSISLLQIAQLCPKYFLLALIALLEFNTLVLHKRYALIKNSSKIFLPKIIYNNSMLVLMQVIYCIIKVDLKTNTNQFIIKAIKQAMAGYKISFFINSV